MKFNSTLKNNYNDLTLSAQRKNLLNTAKIEIDKLKEEMFDVYGIEEIFLLESFYNNEKPYIDKVPVVFKMNYSDFCALVDSKSMRYSNLEIFVETNDGIYSFSKDNLNILKEDFQYDKVYKL